MLPIQRLAAAKTAPRELSLKWQSFAPEPGASFEDDCSWRVLNSHVFTACNIPEDAPTQLTRSFLCKVHGSRQWNAFSHLMHEFWAGHPPPLPAAKDVLIADEKSCEHLLFGRVCEPCLQMLPKQSTQLPLWNVPGGQPNWLLLREYFKPSRALKMSTRPWKADLELTISGQNLAPTTTTKTKSRAKASIKRVVKAVCEIKAPSALDLSAGSVSEMHRMSGRQLDKLSSKGMFRTRASKQVRALHRAHIRSSSTISQNMTRRRSRRHSASRPVQFMLVMLANIQWDSRC